MDRVDPTKLAQWFAAYASALLLYARQWHAGAAADDLVQETFVRLMGETRDPQNVKPWLFRTLRNLAISRMRSESRRIQREMRIARDDYFRPRDEDRLDAAAAQAALEALPRQQREIVVLRIWGDMKFQEIASQLDCGLSTVHDQYRAALAAIRESMVPSCRMILK